MIRSMLQDLGFTEILEAEDGEHALTILHDLCKIKEVPCDLILADWAMPNMPGIDLLRELRDTFDINEIHFIMATSRDNEAFIQEAARAMVSDYLIKPFDSSQLKLKLDLLFPDV